MVSHSHLSAGNSLSSESRNIFAEFGVSNPNSPSLSSPLVLSSTDMAASADLSLNVGLDSIEMVESEANPDAIALSSEDSTSLANEIENNLGQAFESNVSEIFKAAHHFSQKDREEALFERKKNIQIMEFLSAHGLSINDVNAFTSEGKKVNWEHAHKMFDKSPLAKAVAVNTAVSLPTVPPLSGDILVPIKCVGEQSLLERPAQPPNLPKSADARTLCPGSPCEEGDLPRQTSEAPKSWCDIVANSTGKSSRTLSYHPPLSKNGTILVKPPVEVLQRGNQIWSSSLVGYFLHSNLPFKVVEPIARRLWGNMGLSKVFLHSKGYYIFKFQTSADRDNVLASGPWHFSSKIIVLQP